VRDDLRHRYGRPLTEVESLRLQLEVLAEHARDLQRQRDEEREAVIRFLTRKAPGTLVDPHHEAGMIARGRHLTLQ